MGGLRMSRDVLTGKLAITWTSTYHIPQHHFQRDSYLLTLVWFLPDICEKFNFHLPLLIRYFVAILRLVAI